MTIDLTNPHQGHHMCVSREQQNTPRQVGDIWVAPSGTGEQLFNSIKTLYCPEGTQIETSEIPFVEMRK